MKTIKLLVVAFVTLSSFPILAQQVDATAQQNSTTSVSGTSVNNSAKTGANAQAGQSGARVKGSDSASASGSANGPAKGIASANDSQTGSAAAATRMRPVNCELVGKLDSKTAKAGDQVVLKTSEAMKTADGTTIPKGTRLMGHVTDVQAHGSGSEASRLGIQFDRAELKGGQNLAIQSEIQSVAPRANAVAADSMESGDTLGGGALGGGGRGMSGGGGGGGARLGGGGLGGGGLVHSSLGGVAQTTNQAGSAVSSTGGGALRTTDNLAGSATANAGGMVHGTASAAGSETAHATAFPDVMLTGRDSASGMASGTLSSSKKNVHLDSGTQMVLGVAAAGRD